MRVEVLDLHREAVGRTNIVTIHARDIVALAKLQPGVERGDDPAVRLVQDSHAGIDRLILVDDRAGTVGTSVVDDDELEIPKRLGQYGIDRVGDIALAIIDGHQAGNSRHRYRRIWTVSTPSPAPFHRQYFVRSVRHMAKATITIASYPDSNDSIAFPGRRGRGKSATHRQRTQPTRPIHISDTDPIAVKLNCAPLADASGRMSELDRS